MRNKLSGFGLIALLLGGFALAGCLGDSNPSAPSGDDRADEEFNGLDLTSENGGYTESAEPPGYGDPVLMSIKGEEEEVVDLTVPDATGYETDPDFQVYSLRILWGVFDDESENAAETDWSGSISVERGAIKVQRQIRFERMQDYVVLPRESRQVVEFVSKTTSDNDGLLVRIYVPIEDPSVEPNAITFATGPLTRSFDVTELEDLATVVDVGTSGNQVSFRAHFRPITPCPDGFVTGYWVMNGASDRGRFGGAWVAEDGRPIGHVRGHFGVNGQNGPVLFGKVISLNGEFRGILRGTYEATDEKGGSFAGDWFGRGGVRAGRLEGRYMVGERGRRGGFEGSWWTACDPDAPLDDEF